LNALRERERARERERGGGVLWKCKVMDNEEHSEGFGATGGEEQNSSNLAWKSLKRGFGTGGGRNWGALLLGCVDYCPRINMSWNVFQLCAGLKVIGSLMIFLVVSIVGVSYYAVVIANYTPQVLKGGSAATMATALLVLILFHVLVHQFLPPPAPFSLCVCPSPLVTFSHLTVSFY
jgi:hypothetical protein